MDSHHGNVSLLIGDLGRLPTSLGTGALLLLVNGGTRTLRATISLPVISLKFISDSRHGTLICSTTSTFLFPAQTSGLPLILRRDVTYNAPVISFSIKNIPSLIHPNVANLLTPTRSMSTFATRIIALLAQPRLHRALTTRYHSITITRCTLSLRTRHCGTLCRSLLWNHYRPTRPFRCRPLLRPDQLSKDCPP